MPKIDDTGPTALLPFRRKSNSGFVRSERIHRSANLGSRCECDNHWTTGVDLTTCNLLFLVTETLLVCLYILFMTSTFKKSIIYRSCVRNFFPFSGFWSFLKVISFFKFWAIIFVINGISQTQTAFCITFCCICTDLHEFFSCDRLCNTETSTRKTGPTGERTRAR